MIKKYLSEAEVCKVLDGEYKDGLCVIPSYKLRSYAYEKLSDESLRTHTALFGIPHGVLIEPIFYYGYLQGFKVYVKGKKYPREREEFYATNHWKEALVDALSEYEKEKRGR